MVSAGWRIAVAAAVARASVFAVVAAEVAETGAVAVVEVCGGGLEIRCAACSLEVEAEAGMRVAGMIVCYLAS